MTAIEPSSVSTSVSPSVCPEPVHLHPERVTGEPASLRWILPAQLPPSAAGQALDALITLGVLTAVRAETGAVVTCLADGRSWRIEGPAVRQALTEAARRHDDTSRRHDDAALAAAVRVVLDGESGDYLRSHGGRAELVEAHQGRVTLRLSGACTHCPAAGITLDRTLEREIRRRYPALIEVRRAGR